MCYIRNAAERSERIKIVQQIADVVESMNNRALAAGLVMPIVARVLTVGSH